VNVYIAWWRAPNLDSRLPPHEETDTPVTTLQPPFPSTMPPYNSRHTRGPSTKKKALLVGIRYDCNEGAEEWGLIPTSFANVKRFAAFLKSECFLSSCVFIYPHHPFVLLVRYEYTDIVIMTDEDGVEETYRPTKQNLVRPSPQPRFGPAYPDDTFLSFRNAKSRPSVVG